MGPLKARYALEKVIGRGASGSVWVARDLQLGRRVAVKRLDREFSEDAEACTRFEREAWTIAQLRSPHIVQVYDSGVDQGVPFIVMELLHGESLEERLARYQAPSRLPPRIAAGIVSDIARGLTSSHRAGIVHRDLKSGNVFMARESGKEVVKLLDFGIARPVIRADASASEQGLLVGTPQFMSPEHFEGRPLDSQADLWSLAVLAYQMLTGQLPFRGDTLQKLRSRVCAPTFIPPTEIAPELRAEVDRVFERAFNSVASERYATAAELALAIDQAAGDRTPNPVLRALFVDDLEDMEVLIRQWFRRDVKSGAYELYFARSGEEGLDELSRRPDIDVVVTDITMPGMDGLDFLARVPDVNPLVRVVVLSAYYDMTRIRTAMNRGAFDFLFKPIDVDDLRRTIEKCAAHSRSLRQLLDSNQENEILRALLGRSEAERLVAEVRAADGAHAYGFDGTIAVIGLAQEQPTPGDDQPDTLFARLNAHFDLFVPEIHGRFGSIQRFAGDALYAVFHGPDHLRQAVDACLAIVERVRTSNALGSLGQAAFSVAAGIDSDWLVAGGAGSPSLGRFERSVVGSAVSRATLLQRLARPQEVLVSSRLESRLRRHYRCASDARRTLSATDSAVCRVEGRVKSGVIEHGTPTETLEDQLDPVEVAGGRPVPSRD